MIGARSTRPIGLLLLLESCNTSPQNTQLLAKGEVLKTEVWRRS
jgi:hypothetical protein